MKKITFLTIAFLIGFGALNAAAQFPIKLPKINKPKTEPAQTEQPSRNGDDNPASGANQNPARKSAGGDVGFMPQPQPSGVPVLLKNAVNIKIKTLDKYWKLPNERFYTSWIPLINFDLFYDKSEKIWMTVEWFNPDGSLWFSQTVEDNQTRDTSELFDTKASSLAGNFGFRLLNSKTKETIFQGKFNVKKISISYGDARYKNRFMFYVDNDWSLPVGYVGFDEHADWDKDPSPTVYLWFKGDLKEEDFEARLFQNNQQITSTDDGGTITKGSQVNAEERNADSCFEQKEVCHYNLWAFTWKNFLVESFDRAAHPNDQGYVRDNPNATYTKDKPGEYVVKIFYKGQQVRELKFIVQPNGWLAANAFAKQLPLDNLKIVVPVKIIGTLDKYNAAAWKTEAFYGNPLMGFAAP